VNFGSIEEAYLQIPWQQILKTSCFFQMKKIRLNISFKKEEVEAVEEGTILFLYVPKLLSEFHRQRWMHSLGEQVVA